MDLNKDLTTFLNDKKIVGYEAKKMRAELRKKIAEGFTDVEEAWDSIHAPPPSEPEPEAELPQEDP